MLVSHCERWPPALRRVVVLLISALLLCVVWLGIILPINWAYTAHADWRRDAVATLARARGSLAQNKTATTRLKALPTEAIWNKFYSVTKAGNASSMLQSDVGGLLRSNHASVQSLTPLRTVDEDGLTTVGLRVSASMTIDQLKKLLVGMANYPRYLRVERLRVNAPSVQDRSQNVSLTVTLEVFGFERFPNGRAGAVNSAPARSDETRS